MNSRLGPAETRQSSRALAFNKHFQASVDQRCQILHTGNPLRVTHHGVIEIDGDSNVGH